MQTKFQYIPICPPKSWIQIFCSWRLKTVLIYVIKLSITSVVFTYVILSVPNCTFSHISEKEVTLKPQDSQSRAPSYEWGSSLLFSPLSTTHYSRTLQYLCSLTQRIAQRWVPQGRIRYKNPVLSYYQKIFNILYGFNGVFLAQKLILSLVDSHNSNTAGWRVRQKKFIYLNKKEKKRDRDRLSRKYPQRKNFLFSFAIMSKKPFRTMLKPLT